MSAMRKAPPFTYVSAKKLKGGRKEYWRFRHPNLGEFALPGNPRDPAFMPRYKELLAEAGEKWNVRMSNVRKAVQPLAQLDMFQVYFVGIEPDGPIKIGFTSNITERMRDLQIASPYPLTLLATLRGGSALERVIHESLSDTRLSGEWFERSDRLLSFISDIRDGTFII